MYGKVPQYNRPKITQKTLEYHRNLPQQHVVQYHRNIVPVSLKLPFLMVFYHRRGRAPIEQLNSGCLLIGITVGTAVAKTVLSTDLQLTTWLLSQTKTNQKKNPTLSKKPQPY